MKALGNCDDYENPFSGLGIEAGVPDHIAIQLSDETIFFPGFNAAILGTVDDRIAYSAERCIEIIIKTQSMDDLEAKDWFYFNMYQTLGAGQHYPIFVYDIH